MKKNKFLFCDIGNTNTSLVLTDFFKMEKVVTSSHGDFKKDLDELFEENQGGIVTAYISSVCRKGFDLLVKELQRRGIVVKFLTEKRMKRYCDLYGYKISNLNVLGQDLFCDLIGTNPETFRIILDIGTVTKVLAIDERNNFYGASLMAGPEIAKRAIFENTELSGVAETKKKPNYLLSLKTEECLNSGSLFGTAAALANMVRLILSQMKPTIATIYVTGGAAEPLKNYLPIFGINNYIYDPNLAIVGLAKAFEFRKAAGLNWNEYIKEEN